MLQILMHTPAWVFGLLFGLLVLGLQQTRNRQVKPLLAYLLPLGMVILSLVGVTSNFGVTMVPVVLWSMGFLLFAVGGYKLFPIKGILYQGNEKRFYIPGSWIPLWVILAIFFTKYTVAVLYQLNISVTTSVVFMPALCFAYGCFSGYFIARTLCLVRALRNKEIVLSVSSI